MRELNTWPFKWQVFLEEVKQFWYAENCRDDHTIAPGGLFISSPFKGVGGGLIWEGDLFNLKKTVESVLHKELEYKVEIKAQVQ